jgi:hypothetical protein
MAESVELDTKNAVEGSLIDARDGLAFALN